MELTASQVLLLSRCLVASFISLLTLWYFLSPYLLTSSKQFSTDLQQMITESSQANHDEEFLENWMKWRLYLSSSADQRVTVYPNTRVSLTNMTFPLRAEFEWRPEYSLLISRPEKAETVGLVVDVKRPWILPTFMFGLTPDLLDKMYGGSENIPTRGILTTSTDSDRILVQCFMNLVVLTVIFLLWANNPVQKMVAVD